MQCDELAARIQQLQPAASPRDIARVCLLLTTCGGDLNALQDHGELVSVWKDMSLRLQAMTDQHAAMTAELEHLSQLDPRTFALDQVWVLIRAIKVQSQILQLYVGCAETAENSG